jgi:hypothetical protein
MSLILPAALLGAWTCLAGGLVWRLTRAMSDPAWRLAARLLALAILLPLPLADELVGRVQFDRLCRQEAVVEVHVHRAAQARIESVPLRSEPVPGVLVPIVRQPGWLVDERRLVLATYQRLEAGGGRLARLLAGWGLPEVGGTNGDETLAVPPLTFAAACEPPQLQAWLARLGASESPSPPGLVPPRPSPPLSDPGPAPSRPAPSA